MQKYFEISIYNCISSNLLSKKLRVFNQVGGSIVHVTNNIDDMTAKLQRKENASETRIITDKTCVHLSIFKSNENRKFRQGLTLVHRLSDILRIRVWRLEGITEPLHVPKGTRSETSLRARGAHVCARGSRLCALLWHNDVMHAFKGDHRRDVSRLAGESTAHFHRLRRLLHCNTRVPRRLVCASVDIQSPFAALCLI